MRFTKCRKCQARIGFDPSEGTTGYCSACIEDLRKEEEAKKPDEKTVIRNATCAKCGKRLGYSCDEITALQEQLAAFLRCPECAQEEAKKPDGVTEIPDSRICIGCKQAYIPFYCTLCTRAAYEKKEEVKDEPNLDIYPGSEGEGLWVHSNYSDFEYASARIAMAVRFLQSLKLAKSALDLEFDDAAKQGVIDFSSREAFDASLRNYIIRCMVEREVHVGKSQINNAHRKLR